MDKYDARNDRYCWPNSTVLKNKLNIKNENILAEAEREITEISIDNIHYCEPPYNLNYLLEIHRTLFSELYEWAGFMRDVDISKGGTRFCNVKRIEPEIIKIFKSLENEQYLRNFSGDELITKLAALYGDFNMIHPFREGNGRVQRIFFEHLALYNGYRLNWNNVKSKEEWLQANIDSVLVENGRLKSIFSDILSKL